MEAAGAGDDPMKVRIIIELTLDAEQAAQDDPLADILAHAWEAFDQYGETTAVDAQERR
jgi:hypothetical protein